MILVYERVSSEKQDLARQAIQRERAAADYPDAEVVVLPGEKGSAYKTSIFDRPVGSELVRLIEGGDVEAVYADAQDRLSRGEPVEWLTFVATCQRHGTRIVLDGREVRDDDAGVILGVVDQLRARGESRDKSHRIKGGLLEVAKAGRYLGPRRPYGYTFEGEKEYRRLIVHPSEAAAVLRAADWYEAGAGDAEIAFRWNAEGTPSPTGITWEKSSVANVLRSPVIAGLVHLNGETYPGLHDEILDLDRWRGLQEIRATRGKQGGRRPAGGHLFIGGILRCPECRSAFRPRTTPKGHAYYECVGRSNRGRGAACRQSNVDARVLEGLILRGLLDLIFDPGETRARIEAAADEGRERAGKLIAAAEKRLRAVERKRERALADYTDEKIDADDWKAVKARLVEEEAQAEAHAAELQEAAEVAQADAADLDAEREVVARLERLQEIIAGDRSPDSVGIIRQALSSTFERVYLTPGENGSLLVVPQLRREVVAATTERRVLAGGFDHGRAQTPIRQPLPALQRGKAET